MVIDRSQTRLGFLAHWYGLSGLFGGAGRKGGVPMSRFYFNFRQGASFSVDDEGCEFPSVEEAYLGAVAAAQDMWRELLIRREDPFACAFEVTDIKGRELFTLPFSELLEACRDHSAAPIPKPLAGNATSSRVDKR